MKANASKKTVYIAGAPVALFLVSLSFSSFATDGYDPEEGWKIPPPVKKIKNPPEARKGESHQGQGAL